MKSIGHVLKKKRDELGLSQYYVAMELGISQSAYVQIESGTTKLSLERALHLSQILKITLNELAESLDHFPGPAHIKAMQIPMAVNTGTDPLQLIEKQIIDLKEEVISLKKQLISLLKEKNA